MRSHAAQAIYKGEAKANGYNVEIYEWDVSAEDAGKAFLVVNSVTMPGGKLRVYIAPSLGYMIPRIEHVGKSGTVGLVISSENFTECNGFYFPKHTRVEYIHSPISRYIIDYVIEKVERINEAIPESEFTLTLPPGTQVADSRDGKHTFNFEVTDSRSVPQDMRGAIRAEPEPHAWRKGWKGATLLGLALGVVLLAGSWLVRRFRSGRASV